jgi:hypothetical protein
MVISLFWVVKSRGLRNGKKLFSEIFTLIIEIHGVTSHKTAEPFVVTAV